MLQNNLTLGSAEGKSSLPAKALDWPTEDGGENETLGAKKSRFPLWTWDNFNVPMKENGEPVSAETEVAFSNWRVPRSQWSGDAF